MAWLRTGALFTAVTLTHAAVGKPGPLECAPFLASVLDGPVSYRPGGCGPEAACTVVLPANAGRIRRVRGTVVRLALLVRSAAAPAGGGAHA
jgi:hypothetical protein